MERLLSMPPAVARAELGKRLEAGHKLPWGSAAYLVAIDANARLVTALRETCEARQRRPPWSAGDSAGPTCPSA